MRWVDALKQWNAHHKSVNTAHVWMVPRKGTAEHAAVKEIMERAKPANVEKENVARREKSIAQLREATKNMRPGRPPERDYEAENVARREKSIAQLREATKGMKPGVRKDDIVRKSATIAPTLEEMYEFSVRARRFSNLEARSDSFSKWLTDLIVSVMGRPLKSGEDERDYEFNRYIDVLKGIFRNIYGNMAKRYSGVSNWVVYKKDEVDNGSGSSFPYWTPLNKYIALSKAIEADVKLPYGYKFKLVVERPKGGEDGGWPEWATTLFTILQDGDAKLKNTDIMKTSPEDQRNWNSTWMTGYKPPLDNSIRAPTAAKNPEQVEALLSKSVGEVSAKKKAEAKERSAKDEATLAKAKESREKAESASSTEINQEMANRLPAEVVEGSIMPFLKGKEFNLANVFLSAPNMIRSRAVGVIALLEGLKSMKDDEWFGKADEFPKIDVSDPTLREFVSAMNTRSQFEVPSKEQKEIVQNGLPSYVSFDMYRRKGTMGNKSGVIFHPSVSTEGLNLRTKAGRDEKKAREDNVSKIAESYLQRIIAKAGAFAKFLNEKSESMEKARSTKKAEARSSVEFAKSKADAPYVMPDKFYDIAYAFMGDEGKARRYANDLSEKAKGRPVKFWLPRGKNLLASF